MIRYSMTDVILSICIISCNQCELLKRCFESVLLQELPFEYEIIMSDDHSTDGTWELIEEYQKQYPGIVKGVHCYPEETNPTCNSERCGWNKLTAYLNARGKYFVNLDADDYLVGTDVYKRSIERLEEYPECSMCFHKVWHLKDGDEFAKGYSYFEGVKDGSIYDARYIIENNFLDINQGYVTRRNPEIDMRKKFGKYFDDRTITYCHLLYGNAIFLDSFGYTYIQYQGSISNSSGKIQQSIESGMDLLVRIAQLPDFAGLFMKASIRPLANVMRYRNSGVCLPNNKKMSYIEYKGWIFEYFRNEKHTLKDRVKACFLRYYLWMIWRMGQNVSSDFCRKLYGCVINKQEANRMPIEYWKI